MKFIYPAVFRKNRQGNLQKAFSRIWLNATVKVKTLDEAIEESQRSCL
mgnify:CR=1 FL=1